MEQDKRKRKAAWAAGMIMLLLVCGLFAWRVHERRSAERPMGTAAEPASENTAGTAEASSGTADGDAASEAEDMVGQDTEENVKADRPYGLDIASITDEGIEVSWKNAEFADGYEIYRSYEKEGEYELIQDVTAGKKKAYQDNSFDHEQRIVYYKMRGYLTGEDGQKTYSKYTKSIKAKYRENMKLSHSALYLPSGEVRTLEAYFGWGNVADAVWSSDNAAAASIQTDGTVTAVSSGTALITCTSEILGTSLQCTVVVDREPTEPLGEISSRYQLNAEGYWENPNAEDTGDAVIMMTGDMMCTSAQQRDQDSDCGDYNFNESFTYVKDVISEADFAIGNLETMLSSSWPYMVDEVYIDNRANCNAPGRYLDALRYAGFDALAMSNNHNCDAKEQGVIETNELVDYYQFARTGLFSSKEESRVMMADINGIRVGYLSYNLPKSPGFNTKDSDWSEEDVETLLNYYSKERAEQDIQTLRAQGAEYVIVYMHWGVKNAFAVQDNQKQAAQELADLGVDYIVGGHAHLLQPYAEITAADGRVVPCVYSLGDFHSSINQVAGNRDSVILRIRLQRDENGTVRLVENGYIPCYTYTEYEGMYYVTIPLDPSLNGGIALKKYDKFHTRILSEIGDGIEEYLPQTEISDSVQAPYGVKIQKISDEGILVYWKSPENANGYEIYRSYEKEGTYERIADTVDSMAQRTKSHGTYCDNEFDKEKNTVYYKIRSYEYNEQGKKIYSEFSERMTAKYRDQMKLEETQLYLPSGMTRQNAAYFGWGNVQDAVWTSDDPNIASVDENGMITGVLAGTCNIVCSSDNLQTELICSVIVDRRPAEPLEEITARYEQVSPGYWEKTDAEKADDAVIMMTGDMMCTAPQQRKAWDDTEGYNFNESFTYVKKILASSDFAVGNLETLLSSSWPYMSEEAYIDTKPNCNAPARYLDALKYAGFDAVMMSNNHNADGGVNGAIESAEVVDQYQLARTGVFLSDQDTRTLLVNINGIKTGFLSYTPVYPGFNGKDEAWEQEDKDTYLNYYDKGKAQRDVAALKKAGAEYIIVYIHWGIKNVFAIGEDQRQYAQELADMGVDYIVGGHAHLLQEYTELTAADGKKVPCLYSLGDFHSSVNQIDGNRDSVILRIRLVRNEAGEVELAENAYIPCYTYTEYKEMDYVVMPLDPSLNGGIELKKYEKFHSRIQEEIGEGLSEYVPE